MNAHVSISYEESLKARYAAARARTFGSGALRDKAPARNKSASLRDAESFPVIRPIKAKQIIEWQINDIHFDEHVKDWRLAMLSLQGAPMKAYIMRRSRELGFAYHEIVGTSRKRPITQARQLIMWEIKTIVRPGKVQGEPDYISYPEIGRLFGGKDHTSVLHAVREVQARKDREGI